MTLTQVGNALAHFGNYRCLRTQQLCHGTFFPASVMMSLGLRETELMNICGGAKWDGNEWVQAFTDRGCFQISETVEGSWLEQVPGCTNGTWVPADPPVTALKAMHVPRFTDAALHVLHTAKQNHLQAEQRGVHPSDLVRFVVAAHNAGFEGALLGYKQGNVDLNTAHGDYSLWVMREAGKVHDWVLAHPKWRYTGQPFGDEPTS